MGPGWSGELWRRLRSSQFPRRLHQGVPVPGLDQQPDIQQPTRLRVCRQLRRCSSLQSQSLPLPLSAVPPAHGLLLCPVVGLYIWPTDHKAARFAADQVPGFPLDCLKELHRVSTDRNWRVAEPGSQPLSHDGEMLHTNLQNRFSTDRSPSDS